MVNELRGPYVSETFHSQTEPAGILLFLFLCCKQTKSEIQMNVPRPPSLAWSSFDMFSLTITLPPQERGQKPCCIDIASERFNSKPFSFVQALPHRWPTFRECHPQDWHPATMKCHSKQIGRTETQVCIFLLLFGFASQSWQCWWLLESKDKVGHLSYLHDLDS